LPLTDPAITAVADGCGRTPAQVLIRWHLQLGNIVIPKSVDPTRTVSSFDVLDMASICSPDDGSRLGPDPRTFNSQAGE
jgi:2,5-diketo-D-gluconate reductase A